MKKLWTGYSEEKLIEAERHLFKLSGVADDEYKSYPVYFRFDKSDWESAKSSGESTDSQTHENNTQNGNFTALIAKFIYFQKFFGSLILIYNLFYVLYRSKS